jgi:hypothetical protein
MIYALNVYDIVPGKESMYAEYAAGAGVIIGSLDMRIVAAGEKPLRSLCGRARNHFALAEFANVATFDTLMQRLGDADLHRLREGATANYIWTLYEPWLFGE